MLPCPPAHPPGAGCPERPANSPCWPFSFASSLKASPRVDTGISGYTLCSRKPSLGMPHNQRDVELGQLGPETDYRSCLSIGMMFHPLRMPC